MTLNTDARYALRSLLRAPGFTSVAVLTLALGVGANTAIFSVVDAVLLRPLPFHDAQRLVMLWETNVRAGRDEIPFSYPDYADVVARAHRLKSSGAMVLARLTVGGKPEPEQVQGAYVTAGFFSTLAVQPVAGRLFDSADDARGGPARAVLGYALWQRRFAGDPAVVGRRVSLDGTPFEVVGVLPASFRFSNFAHETEIWLPFSQDPFTDRRYARAVHGMGVIARLADGATLGDARADIDRIASELRSEHPDDNATLGLRAVDLHQQAVHNLRPAVLLLDGAVAFVLLIACANVANLLAARATGRRRETAVRLALGASTARLVRQWLTEGAILGLAGAGGGLLLALWGVDLLSHAPLREGTPFAPYGLPPEDIRLNLVVLGFGVGLALLAGLAVTGLAAWQSLGDAITGGLRDGAPGGTSGPRRQRLLGRLVSVQMALSMTLLTGAFLSLASFSRLVAVDPGFTATDVLAFDVNLAHARYPDDARTATFFDTLLERLRALPGVTGVGGVEYMPLSGAESTTTAFADGQPMPAHGQEIRVTTSSVTPDYFRTLGVSVRRGRAFTAADRGEGPRVAIVNETLARRLWPGQDPVGRRVSVAFESLRFFRDRAPELVPALGMREVVGVVADIRQHGLDGAPPAAVYFPFAQRAVGDLTIVVGTAADAGELAAPARQLVTALDHGQPISNVRTLRQIVDASVAQPRFSARLIGAFALVALILSGVGIYGVLAFVVTQRTRETGVRLAIGAQPGDIMAMMVSRGLRLTAVGLAVGLAGAAAASTLLSRNLYGVSPAEPMLYLGSATVVLFVALAGCYLPARRAARLDPASALRYE